MMNCSQCPVPPQLKPVFTQDMKKNSGIVRRDGARPVLFMSGADKDVPSMTQALADAYTTAGRENHAE